MIKAQRLGHATFETPDVQKSIDYFVNVNGLVLVAQDASSAHLATKLGQLCISLTKADRAHCTRLSFEVPANSDFAAMAKGLASEGIKSELRSDPFPGSPQALVFADPSGTVLELFSQWSFLDANKNVAGVGPLKIGHVAFFVPELEKVIAFYERILNFKVSDWLGDQFVFMRCNPEHHTVNFFRSDSTRVHHMAFELKDFAHIQQGCETLSMHRIPLGWGPLRQGAGHNIAAYHRSCDDHVVEFFCELDQMKNEDLGYFEPRPWHTDRPQRPKVWPRGTWVDGWGTPPAPNFARNERALGTATT